MAESEVRPNEFRGNRPAWKQTPELSNQGFPPDGPAFATPTYQQIGPPEGGAILGPQEQSHETLEAVLANLIPSVAMLGLVVYLSSVIGRSREGRPGANGLAPLLRRETSPPNWAMAAIIVKAGLAVELMDTTDQYNSDGDDEFEELEILPVTDEVYEDEAFMVEYRKDRSSVPCQRALKNVKSCKKLRHLPHSPDSLRWVNVTGTQNSLTKAVLEAYDVHPLFVEDILNDAERSKVENLGTNELVVLFQAVQLVEETYSDDSEDEDELAILKLKISQVSILLQGERTTVDGKEIARTGALLSFFNAPTKTVEQCKAMIRISNSRLRMSSNMWLLHMIMDKEVDRLFPIMNKFRTQLENVQNMLKDPKTLGSNPNMYNKRVLSVLQSTSQEMNNLLFVLRPLASTVASLTEHARHEGATELQWHFNDLRDHIATILDYVASMQSWARALKDDYSYIQQDSMNRTMYLLTLITALFIPAQFLTGLFGMNFQYMPWLDWKHGYWAFWGVIGAINAIIVFCFKKIRWL